ncbi:N-acetylneuraminate lyase [Niameybacter massiliensis]|uniref:N-acetylneuraminate lyase n=1 Tax=Niameybacter massiliensis TaxID=1658108 RepID=UPI0006B6744B|nr:N-acetylneuraminate lyase [Niameybacter massiliensis]
MGKDIKGLLAALTTPYTPSGEIDYKQLREIVEFLIRQGMNGFYVCGSTGEAFLLTDEERKKIVEVVVNQVAGRVPVVAHIGNIGTRKTIELGLHAKAVGVDAISSVSPFYYKFSYGEIKSYYDRVADACELPMIVYNFPSLVGTQFSIEQLEGLLSHSLIKGLKHTSQDLYQLERIKNRRSDLVVYNGFDEMLLSGLIAGADGGIGSTYNCMPQLYINLLDHFKAGDIEEAKLLQSKANHVIEYIVKYGVMQSVKVLLGCYGFEDNGCREPFKMLKEEEKKVLQQVFKQYLS